MMARVLATAWALFSGPTRYVSLATVAFFAHRNRRHSIDRRTRVRCELAGGEHAALQCVIGIGEAQEYGDRSRPRFGSRVDVYLPAGTEPRVLLGQKTIAGETILAELGHVAEGVYSAPVVLARARALGVEMPITETVVEVEKAGTRMVPVRVRIKPGVGQPGSNTVRFEISAEDDPSVAVHEKSTFYIPR